MEIEWIIIIIKVLAAFYNEFLIITRIMIIKMILSVLAADYVFGQVCINSDYNTKKVGF